MTSCLLIADCLAYGSSSLWVTYPQIVLRSDDQMAWPNHFFWIPRFRQPTTGYPVVPAATSKPKQQRRIMQPSIIRAAIIEGTPSKIRKISGRGMQGPYFSICFLCSIYMSANSHRFSAFEIVPIACQIVGTTDGQPSRFGRCGRAMAQAIQRQSFAMGKSWGVADRCR